jgi:PAS domain-containing protein
MLVNRVIACCYLFLFAVALTLVPPCATAEIPAAPTHGNLISDRESNNSAVAPIRAYGSVAGFSNNCFYIFGPLLFILTITGFWYMKREVARKSLGLREEIQAHKMADEALKESERKYRELFELSPVGIFKTNSKGQALFVNPEMARIVGANSSQEAVDSFQDLANDLYVDPNRRKAFIDLMRDTGAAENFEFEARG